MSDPSKVYSVLLYFILQLKNNINIDETFKKKQKLTTFLTIRDEEDPIVPSFYAFGAGSSGVQVGGYVKLEH